MIRRCAVTNPHSEKDESRGRVILGQDSQYRAKFRAPGAREISVVYSNFAESASRTTRIRDESSSVAGMVQNKGPPPPGRRSSWRAGSTCTPRICVASLYVKGPGGKLGGISLLDESMEHAETRRSSRGSLFWAIGKRAQRRSKRGAPRRIRLSANPPKFFRPRRSFRVLAGTTPRPVP